MFRLNRGRVIGLLLTSFIIYFLFISSTNTNSDFRKRTEAGLSRRHGILQGDLSDEAYRAQTNQQLNDILSRQQQQDGQKPMRASDEGAGPAKPKADEREKQLKNEVAEDEESKSVAGRKTMPKDMDKPKYPKDKMDEKSKQKGLKAPGDDGKDAGESEEKEGHKKEQETSSDPGKDMARVKLQEYLKKPIVIFSKSHCPHSKRAKYLLLEVYKIVPPPFVVELDKLTERVPAPKKAKGKEGDDDSDNEDDAQGPTLGQKLQELLREVTGRGTVPNIMVGTTSIGGNDLLWEMHEEGTLAKKIQDLSGKRISTIELVDQSEGTSGR